MSDLGPFASAFAAIASGPDEHCPTSKDPAMIHCDCWYDHDRPCCWCSTSDHVECQTCHGTGCRLDGAVITKGCPDCTPENVEELAEADIAAGNLGEPMTTEQMREAMSKLRRLGDRSTPENVDGLPSTE